MRLHCLLVLVWAALLTLLAGTLAMPSRGWIMKDGTPMGPNPSPYNLYKQRGNKRVMLDAGLLSRNSAIENFLNHLDAQEQAADPWGPGKRK